MAENKLDQVEQQADNTRWPHKWGFADTHFVAHADRSVSLTGQRYNICGYKMPYFVPYLEDILGITFNPDEEKAEIQDKPITPPQRNEAFCQSIEQHFKAHQYRFDNQERLSHSHGQTTEELYKVLYSRLERAVDMVFYCESEADVQALIPLAAKHKVCLVPYGGGTNVSRALELPQQEERMIVAVDTRRMNQIEWIDTENFRACVQAGITGTDLEIALNKAGFTSGHEPDSIELSTLGGWIATNASGMKKNRYGNIEQIVEKIEIITPTGKLEQIAPTPRSSMGIQPQNLLFGNEGNLGIITKAIIRIHRKPTIQKYGSIVFPSFDKGVEFLYELKNHSGSLPASIRLVDNAQFRFGQTLKPRLTGFQAWLEALKKFYLLKIRGFHPKQLVAVTIVFEGSSQETAYQEANLYALAKQYRGMPAGATNGQRGYMLTYAIAYLGNFMAAFNVTGETFETTVPWSNIKQVCSSVESELQRQHQQFGLSGRVFLSYRISQLYHTGVCVYFTFAICTKGVSHPDVVLSKIEQALRKTIMENGGSISHHHGIGKIRQDFMKDTLSETSIQLLKKLKKDIDPDNVFGIRNSVFSD